MQRPFSLLLAALAALPAFAAGDVTPAEKARSSEPRRFVVPAVSREDEAAKRRADNALAARKEAAKSFHILYDQILTTEAESQIAALKAERYIIVYQSVDPQAVKTGKVDSAKIIAFVKKTFGPNPSGWGMLDYENPFNSIISKGPDGPQYDFVISEMVNALREVKQAFPDVKWTYYGFPGLSYWPGGGKLWAQASPEHQKAEIERQIRNNGPIMMECDWYAPCTYDVYDQTFYTDMKKKARHTENEPIYRKNRIGVVKEFLARNDLPARPIIPMISPFYATGGTATFNALIPESEFLSDQLMPAIEHADGIAIWTAGQFWVNAATKSTNTTSTQKRVRTVYQKDLLDDAPVPDWTNPSLKQKLLQKVASVVVRTAELARERAPEQAAKEPAATAKPREREDRAASDGKSVIRTVKPADGNKGRIASGGKE